MGFVRAGVKQGITIHILGVGGSDLSEAELFHDQIDVAASPSGAGCIVFGFQNTH